MAEMLAQLEAEYCPPIDPALLSAILSDYDLTRNDDIESARSTLDSLKESALVEEAAGFDASGTGGLNDSGDSGDHCESYTETSTSNSKETDLTSVSNRLSSLNVDGLAQPETSTRENDDIEQLNDDTKIQLLRDVFGEQVTRYSIESTLSKCNGNWSAALEELLNHVYLNEAAEDQDAGIFSAKGVDGFAGDGMTARGRKGEAKNKRFRQFEERRSSSMPGEDIEIVPHYARPDALDPESTWDTRNRKTKSVTSSRSPSSDRLPAAARKDAYDLARAAALSQASAARRKARSDQLMSGAAAYYSQVSREYASLSSSASARAADELVSSQSTATQLDLHGVDVRNAVRIAQERVNGWWDGLGENRINGRIGASDRQSGYSIVVGRGIHSQGGNSKLGPAVTKILRQEGWRVELSGGVVVVRGPARK